MSECNHVWGQPKPIEDIKTPFRFGHLEVNGKRSIEHVSFVAMGKVCEQCGAVDVFAKIENTSEKPVTINTISLFPRLSLWQRFKKWMGL